MSIEETYELYEYFIRLARQMDPGDPNFETVMEAIKKLGQIIHEYEQRDLERNHNNIQDDLSEEELKVNAKKVKVDLIRSVLDFCGKILFLGGSVIMGGIAYSNEAIKFNLPSSKGLLDAAKNLLSSFKK